MSHPNLSDGINQNLDAVKDNSGFRLSDLPDNSLFMLITENSMYGVLVLDARRRLVALVGTRPGFEEPDVFYFNGCTFGGSMLMMNHVTVGMRPELVSFGGKMLTLSKLESFVLINDTERAKQMRKYVEEKRPEVFETPDAKNANKWGDSFDEKVREEFAGGHLGYIESLLTHFSVSGRRYVANFLLAAKEADKLPWALTVVTRHMREYWIRRPVSIRGEVRVSADTNQWLAAYTELDLPYPK